jgi:hypothetical protein
MCPTRIGLTPVEAEIMNTQTIAMIAAGVGVAFSVAYIVLGVIGIKMLRDQRDR